MSPRMGLCRKRLLLSVSLTSPLVGPSSMSMCSWKYLMLDLQKAKADFAKRSYVSSQASDSGQRGRCHQELYPDGWCFEGAFGHHFAVAGDCVG